MWKLKLFYRLQGTLIFELFKKMVIRKWKRAGCPLPAPYTVKRERIKSVAREFNCQIFVETGTYLGATTAEMIKHFKKLYTIELSDDLFKQAQLKFLNINI
jgi:predicted O-methyltransferase YrrM